MVALFSFFHHLQVVVEFGCLFKSRPVDTLEHLVLFVAPPVRTGDGLDLKGFDPACRFAVRTGTEVVEVALAIDGDDGIFRKVFDEFYFIILAGIFEHLQRIGTGEDFFGNGKVFFYDLRHFSFNGTEVVLCEAVFCVEIIVETVFNGRANGELNARIEVLNRLGHDMRGCMAKGVLPFLIGKGEEFDGRAVNDRFTKVRDFAVYPCDQYFFSKTVAQFFYGLGKRNAIGKLFFASIFQQ